MKYLKYLNEGRLGLKYNDDDYILLDLENIKNNAFFKAANTILLYLKKEDKFFEENYKFAQIHVVKFDDFLPYRVKFYDGVVLDIDENAIIRLLTPDEIQTFEALKTGSKFNL